MPFEDVEEPYENRGEGAPDATQRMVELVQYLNIILGQFVTAQPYTIVPIFVNEQFRDTQTYRSSTLDKLKPVMNTFVASKSGGPSVSTNVGGAVTGASGGIGGIIGSLGLSGIVSAVGSSATGVVKGSTGRYNFLDLRPFTALTLFGVNTHDQAISVTPYGCWEPSFSVLFQLDDVNVPFSVPTGTDASPGTDYETLLGDAIPWAVVEASAAVAPTRGAFTLIAAMRR